jgi:hypothetical protein
MACAPTAFLSDRLLQGMEYRGIRYTIRTRIERDQWSVAIHPAGVEMKGRVVIGSRRDAELQAHVQIDSWLNPRKVLRQGHQGDRKSGPSQP